MSDALPTIRCPHCGSHRVVTHRQERRARLEGATACATCRSGSNVRSVRERDLRFWFDAYGSPQPPQPIRQAIAAGGAPPELVELARSIFPT
jgi:hypothetical protein